MPQRKRKPKSLLIHCQGYTIGGGGGIFLRNSLDNLCVFSLRGYITDKPENSLCWDLKSNSVVNIYTQRYFKAEMDYTHNSGMVHALMFILIPPNLDYENNLNELNLEFSIVSRPPPLYTWTYLLD